MNRGLFGLIVLLLIVLLAVLTSCATTRVHCDYGGCVVRNTYSLHTSHTTPISHKKN